MLLLLAAVPVALATVQIDADMLFTPNGNVDFNWDCTADDVTLNATAVYFTNLAYSGVTYPALSLSPSANANLTVTDLHISQLIFNASAAAGSTAGVRAGTRTVTGVTGVLAWAGTPQAVLTLQTGVEVVTVFFSGGTASGFGGGVLIVVAILVLLVLALRRR